MDNVTYDGYEIYLAFRIGSPDCISQVFILLKLGYTIDMKNYLTTGKFAKMAHVSERTIRYYDKEGLLKPSFVMENGYRAYDEDDFVQLQKIISLKQIGFSLDEIKMMNNSADHTSFKHSLQLQIDLLDKKIKHSQRLKEALIRTENSIEQESDINWNSIVSLIQMSNQEEKIIDHYRDANHLAIRMQLHDKYSTNRQGWFPWLFSQIDFTQVNRLLEVGCGSGDLWKSQFVNTRYRELFLSDISEGMIQAARDSLGENYSYMVIDAQKIPFKQEYFDAVIANHMLFYLPRMDQGLKEIARVLKPKGILYCSTYGTQHMCEITTLVKEFDDRIVLSDHVLSDAFGLDDGEQKLQAYFYDIEIRRYQDELIVNEMKPLFDYIMSCHGNQMELLSNRMDEFKQFLNHKLEKDGAIHITKDAGVFICKRR